MTTGPLEYRATTYVLQVHPTVFDLDVYLSFHIAPKSNSRPCSLDGHMHEEDIKVRAKGADFA